MFREQVIRVRGPEGAEAQAEAARRRLRGGNCRGDACVAPGNACGMVVVGAQHAAPLHDAAAGRGEQPSPQGPDPKAPEGWDL